MMGECLHRSLMHGRCQAARRTVRPRHPAAAVQVQPRPLRLRHACNVETASAPLQRFLSWPKKAKAPRRCEPPRRVERWGCARDHRFTMSPLVGMPERPYPPTAMYTLKKSTPLPPGPFLGSSSHTCTVYCLRSPSSPRPTASNSTPRVGSWHLLGAVLRYAVNDVAGSGTGTVCGFGPLTVQFAAMPDNATGWLPAGPVKLTLPFVAIGWLFVPSMVTV